nr:YdhK family protein [Bacillus sp. ISL-47]
MINKVHLNALQVKETIEAHFAETMSSSGEVPDELKEAENPAFEIGSQAIIEADHMPGMKGAVATISGAYETIAYSVTYYPTTGGEPVKDHKWVIHEEIENAGEEPLEPGTEITLKADHMEGMDEATAVVESAVETTVYMLDFTTTTGEKVEDHKWIIEGELSPIE